MSTPFCAFGPGILIVQNLALTTPVAINIGYAQEFSVDLSATPKELYGQNQFPLAIARGTVKATGKVKAAVLSGTAWNAAFFGQTMTAGGWSWNVGEKHTLAATTQQVTNHTTFETDLGVTYTANKLPLQRVAPGSETTGYYSVSLTTGIYTFSTSDSTTQLAFTYTNTITTPGQTLTVVNKILGDTPVFQLDYYTSFNQPTAKPFAVRLYNAVGNKISIATKLEDFIMPEIDFGFFADSQDRVISYVYPEIS